MSFAALLVALSAIHQQPVVDDRCATAFVEAQRLRQASALLLARERLGACAQPSCPAALQERCTTWLDEVRAEIPSARFLVRDERGLDVDTSVVVDGTLEAVVGIPIELDPGAHQARAAAIGVERSFVLLAGQHALIELSAPTATPPTSPPPPGAVTTAPASTEPPRWVRGALVGASTAGVELVAVGVLVGAAALAQLDLELASVLDLVGVGAFVLAVAVPPVAAPIFHSALGGDHVWLASVGGVGGSIAVAAAAGIAALVGVSVAGVQDGASAAAIAGFAAAVGAVIGAGAGAGLGAFGADSISDVAE